MMRGFRVLVFGLVLLGSFTITCHGALQAGFYTGKCGRNNVEAIIRSVVQSRFSEDTTVVAALLRLQFHDCFVAGCDASLLLNGPNTEKTADPNLSVRGYDLIDEVKDAVERACPGVVSCADIIAVASRDAVFMAKGLNYKVETGRRDGLVSLAQDVDLPPPSISVEDAIAAFARKGLNKIDMVLLLGAHTVGVTHCSVVQDRLYNFRNTGRKDPTIGLHRETRAVVKGFVIDPLDKSFQKYFGAAMIKMGRVGVLTGRNEGEIRRTCGAVN